MEHKCQSLYTKFKQQAHFLSLTVANVSQSDRAYALTPKSEKAVTLDKRCVWSCKNAPGLRDLFSSCDLNLSDINPRALPALSRLLSRGRNAYQLISRGNGNHADSIIASVGIFFSGIPNF